MTTMTEQAGDNQMATTPLARQYCIVHRQGFVPIFVSDGFDAVQLAEAAAAAGAKVVEITCRRTQVREDIRRVRAAFPDLLVLAGSVIDEGPIARFLRMQRPWIPSLAELCDLGVDGFVSAMPLMPMTIARLSATHLVVPGVETVAEAVVALEAGAHLVKSFTANGRGEWLRVAQITGAPLHGMLPIFVTGGVTLEKIEPYVAARAAVLGSGWDVILGQRYTAVQDNPNTTEISWALRRYLDATTAAREKHQPQLGGDECQSYLRSIPHFHPFAT